MEIALVLTLLLIAIVLFSTEKFPVDFVAVMVLGALLALRLVTPEEGVSGFANPVRRDLTVALQLEKEPRRSS